MSEDYYKVLGVARGASSDEISKSYRDLARKNHPDLNPDDRRAKERFQKIQQAYEVLKDPEKRKMYDQFGSNYDQFASGGGPGGGPGAAGADVDLNDLFGGIDLGQIFGMGGGGRSPFGGGRRSGPPRGKDIEQSITIPFTVAVLGGAAQVTVPRQRHPEAIQVKIPAGIENGAKMRLRGQGAPGRGGRGQPGDLLLTVLVAPHPHFQRQGRDLHVKVPLALNEAALGAKVDVPTPHGTLTLTVPPCTSSGKRLRLKGYGVQPASGPAGDLYAEIEIQLPELLSDEEQALFRQWAQRHPEAPRQKLSW